MMDSIEIKNLKKSTNMVDAWFTMVQECNNRAKVGWRIDVNKKIEIWPSVRDELMQYIPQRLKKSKLYKRLTETGTIFNEQGRLS